MFNLTHPYPIQVQRHLTIIRLELLVLAVCLLLSVIFLRELTSESQLSPASNPVQPKVHSPVSHPLGLHLKLWSMVSADQSDILRITRIEYTGTVWHLEIISTAHAHIHRWLEDLTATFEFHWELNSLRQIDGYLSAQVTISL